MLNRSIYLSTVAFVMLLSVSCEEKDAERTHLSNEMNIRIINDASSKVGSGEDYSVTWEEGDKFTAVYNTGTIINHNDDSYSNMTSYWSKELVDVNADGTLTLNVPENCTQALLIYYGRQSAAKYQYVSGYGRSCIRTKLDSLLAYDSSRHMTKNNTAIGTIDLVNKTVAIKGCMAQLKLTLPSRSGVSDIRVCGNGVMITGYPFFDVRGTYHDKMLADQASDRFTLSAIDSQVSRTYYIPILPANYRNGITVTLTDANNNVLVSKTMTASTLQRRGVYEIDLSEVFFSEIGGGNESYEDFMVYGNF